MFVTLLVATLPIYRHDETTHAIDESITQRGPLENVGSDLMGVAPLHTPKPSERSLSNDCGNTSDDETDESTSLVDPFERNASSN